MNSYSSTNVGGVQSSMIQPFTLRLIIQRLVFLNLRKKFWPSASSKRSMIVTVYELFYFVGSCMATASCGCTVKITDISTAKAIFEGKPCESTLFSLSL